MNHRHEAVITRADGTVENMGVIARHDGSKIFRAASAIRAFLRSLTQPKGSNV